MKTIDWLKLHKDEIIFVENVSGGLKGLVKFTMEDDTVIKLDQGITDVGPGFEQFQLKVIDKK